MVGEAFARPLARRAGDRRLRRSRSLRHRRGRRGASLTPETKARLLAAAAPASWSLDAAGASETGGGLVVDQRAGPTAEAGVFTPPRRRRACSTPTEPAPRTGRRRRRLVRQVGPHPARLPRRPRRRQPSTFPVVDGIRYAVPGDRARLAADGMVELLGRDSVTINTGGEKVFAEEVEQALLTPPRRGRRRGRRATERPVGQRGRRRGGAARRARRRPTASCSTPRRRRWRATSCPRRSCACRRSCAARRARPTTRGRGRSSDARAPDRAGAWPVCELRPLSGAVGADEVRRALWTGRDALLEAHRGWRGRAAQER